MSHQHSDNILLAPGELTLALCRRVATADASVMPSLRLHDSARALIAESADVIAAAAAGERAVYGVNTGFGKLASVRIDAGQLAQLQSNLILSHAAGIGPALDDGVVRLVLLMKLASFARGASGVRLTVTDLLEQMLQHDLLPVIPAQGSVGASGDLAPLAHLAAAMMGQGRMRYRGQELSAEQALQQAGLEPLVFAAKEGLAMINGTQVSTALALVALFQTHDLLCSALLTGALSTDAGMGSSAPFMAVVHELRGHQAQIDCAASLRELLQASAIRQSHVEGDERVQDPYCLRCQPQVMGACLQLLRQAADVLKTEACAVTDNPLLDIGTGAIYSGGNFHAEPVAFAADQIALAIAEIGSIAQRRIAMLIDPAMNYGLPAFLTPQPGLHSGFMIAEVTSAALMSENKQRSTPCSTDSIPTSANQEDHVSMACHAAYRLLAMNHNLAGILGIEWLIAAQGVEMRQPLQTSPVLQTAIDILRSKVGSLQEDRFMSTDIEQARHLLSAGALLQAGEQISLPALEAACV